MSVFFSHNAPKALKNEVLNVLRPVQDSRHSKYLGLPTIIGKSKIEVFAEIKESREKVGWLEGKNALNRGLGIFSLKQLPKQSQPIP